LDFKLLVVYTMGVRVCVRACVRVCVLVLEGCRVSRMCRLAQTIYIYCL